MNKSKTRGQLISKLQYMKSQPNGNAIQHICYKDIDNICNYLLEDKNEIERLKEENNKVYHYVSYLQEYCDNLEKENKKLIDEVDEYKHEYYSECDLREQLEKALDKACELISSDICINCYACYFEKECKSKEADKCIANNMNKEEWKEWCLKDVE